MQLTSTSGEQNSLQKMKERRTHTNLGPLGALGNMDPVAIVSKMSSISNFSNSVSGKPQRESQMNVNSFPNVAVFNMQPDADDDDDDEPKQPKDISSPNYKG